MPRKDKGKSRRRIKDWKIRYETGGDAEDGAARREKFTRRQVKLGDGSFAAGGDEGADRNLVEGMVTGVFRRGAFVRIGGEDTCCGIAKTFRPPEGFENTTPLAVGDIVTVARAADDHVDGQLELDGERTEGMILSRALRGTLLARPECRRGRRRDEYSEPFVRVVAANMDMLLVVASVVKPAINRGLLDRFLIAARRGDLAMAVAINKIDLREPDEQVGRIAGDMRAEGARVIYCSAVEARGIDELAKVLSGKRTVLAGASGVGKTTLVNALVPEAEAATRPVREKDQRGRHTTSQARVYDLPCGGVLIDTPGIRELGLGLTGRELAWYFSDFEKLAPSCKFRDCTHTHEPGCAIVAAVEAGEVPLRRYEGYLRIMETVED